MNTPSRAKESDRLISQLTDIMNADIRPDKAVLMQLEWQAKKCERIDPLGAHVALAMIAVLRFDCAATKAHFEEALRRGWHPVLGLNYAAALHRFYHLEDALQQAYRVMDQGPGDCFTLALEHAVQCAYEIGRLHVASQLLTVLQENSAPASETVKRIAADLPSLAQAAHALALTDDMMAVATEQAWAVIRRTNKPIKIDIDDFVGNDGDLFLSRTLLLPVSFEEARQMDIELMALQADSEIPLSKFCVSFRDQPAP